MNAKSDRRWIERLKEQPPGQEYSRCSSSTSKHRKCLEKLSRFKGGISALAMVSKNRFVQFSKLESSGLSGAAIIWYSVGC